jgi:hypothetical protein
LILAQDREFEEAKFELNEQVELNMQLQQKIEDLK